MVTDDPHLAMDTGRKQRTIGRPAAVAGFGYWSGRDVRLEFRPAEVNAGIVFVRGDLPGCPAVPARVACRVDAPRRTSLRSGTVAVEMVEHVLAALAGLGIDNCAVWLDQPEVPGLDGSAVPFVEALDAAGIVRQDAWQPRRLVERTVRVGSQDQWIEVRPPDASVPVFRYELDYGSAGPIGRQVFEIALTPDSFRRELAPCRTFLLKAEAQWLHAQGIGRRTTARDLLVFDEGGPIDNHERFPDECARHKLLDLVGDLALAGCDLVGRFSAYRSGHHHNAELVRALVPDADAGGARRRCA